MGDLNKVVALEVRGHLARRRLKRNDVATVLAVSLRTVSDLLGERRPWRVDELETIAAWLDISVSELLFPKRPRHRARGDLEPQRPPREAPRPEPGSPAIAREPGHERPVVIGPAGEEHAARHEQDDVQSP